MEVAPGTPQTGSHPTQLNTIGFRAFSVSFSFVVVLVVLVVLVVPKLFPWLSPNCRADGDFVFSDVDLEAGQPIFIDPEIAIGYLYDVEELPGEIESIFDSVRVDPAGSDIDFTISFEDESGATILASLTAGETFIFPTTVDVLSFQILDIDPAENLPADNPLAFSTLLTFRNDLNGATIIQSPISVAAVPEPSSALLLIISGSVVLLRRRR